MLEYPGDAGTKADLLRSAAGDHPLVDRRRFGTVDATLAEIDRFLRGDRRTRILPRRRGCLFE